MGKFELLGREWILDKRTGKVRRAKKKRLVNVFKRLSDAEKSAFVMTETGMVRDIKIKKVL